MENLEDPSRWSQLSLHHAHGDPSKPACRSPIRSQSLQHCRRRNTPWLSYLSRCSLASREPEKQSLSLRGRHAQKILLSLLQPVAPTPEPTLRRKAQPEGGLSPEHPSHGGTARGFLPCIYSMRVKVVQCQVKRSSTLQRFTPI